MQRSQFGFVCNVYVCMSVCMYVRTCMYISHTLISVGSVVTNAHRHWVHMVTLTLMNPCKRCVNRP